MFDERIVCTYLYVITKYGYPPPAKSTPSYLTEMKRLGFQSVELEGIRSDHLVEMYDMRHDIRARMDRLGLKVPFFCAVLPGMSSPDKEIRQSNLNLFRKGCEIANLLGAGGIVDNAPLPPYVFPDDIPIVRHFGEDVLTSAVFPKDLGWTKFWKDLVQTFREVCDVAAEFGLAYELHPSIGVLSSNTDGFLYFAEAVNRENLRFNLDTANQYVMKENLSLALRRLDGMVDYVHLSDARGHKVEHLKVGDGSINWSTFFDTLQEIGFAGHIGLDIGGDESDVGDLDEAYVSTAEWLSNFVGAKG